MNIFGPGTGTLGEDYGEDDPLTEPQRGPLGDPAFREDAPAHQYNQGGGDPTELPPNAAPQFTGPPEPETSAGRDFTEPPQPPAVGSSGGSFAPTKHTTTVWNGPVAHQRHYVMGEDGNVIGSYLTDLSGNRIDAPPGVPQQASTDTTRHYVRDEHGRVVDMVTHPGARAGSAGGRVAGPAGTGGGAVPGGDGGLYVADPATQQMVKEAEQALLLTQQDNSLDEKTGQKQRAVADIQKKIDQLDPQKLYRKGGLLSRQTDAEKKVAQNSLIDPHTGVRIIFDPQGKPHWDPHGSDPLKFKMEMLKMQETEREHLRKADEHRWKQDNTKAAQAEKAKTAAEKVESDLHERNLKHDEKHGSVFDAVRKLSHPKDVLGKPEPLTPEQEVAHLADRRKYIKEQRVNDIRDEAARAEKLFKPERSLYSMPYVQAYEMVNGALPPAHTTAELKRRHDEAVALAREKVHGPGSGPPHTPPSQVQQDAAAVAAANRARRPERTPEEEAFLRRDYGRADTTFGERVADYLRGR